MSLLHDVLIDPACVRDWPEPYWETLLREARRANLLAHVAARLDTPELASAVPPRPGLHLLAASRVAQRQYNEVCWEIRCIRLALQEVGLPVVLLKGAAYVARELSCARGRLLSDIDLLIPRERLAEAERALIRHGWMTLYLDDYDQRYYRRWMHELPPMQHVVRETTLDVHHSITPLTSRYSVDGAALWARAEPLASWPGVWTLSPVDLVIHSATHLTLEGELDNGLRDLVDLRELLEVYGEQPAFWRDLSARAEALGLAALLALALDLTRDRLGAEIPAAVLQGARNRRSRVVERAFRAALPVRAPGSSAWIGAVARGLLYLRGHYLRMPFRLLIPHLVRKAWRREADAQA